MQRRQVLAWLLGGCGTVAAHGGASAAGEERRGGRSRPLATFDEVVIDAPVNVVIRAGAPAVVVHAQGRLADGIQVAVRGHALQLSARHGVADADTPLVEVFAPSLHALAVRGGSDVDAAEVFGERLHVSLAGSGTVRLTGLALDHLDLRLSGSGTVQAAGRCQDQDLLLEGSGSFEGFELSGSHARIRIPGSGAAEVAVSAQLEVSISGSGSVTYRGSPEVREEISGSGHIEPDPG